jgi:hypothetical protein
MKRRKVGMTISSANLRVRSQAKVFGAEINSRTTSRALGRIGGLCAFLAGYKGIGWHPPTRSTVYSPVKAVAGFRTQRSAPSMPILARLASLYLTCPSFPLATLNAHCGKRPQHCLYFLPTPHGQGSFRPTFCPVECVTTGDAVDFEDDAYAVLELRFAEDSFHRPEYEMLRAVSVIGRNPSGQRKPGTGQILCVAVSEFGRSTASRRSHDISGSAC